MKWGLGFGLERLGLAALARPWLSSMLLLTAIVANLSFLPTIAFDGNVVSILPSRSEALTQYEEQKERFRDFSRDIVVIVRSPRLMTASGLEDLRFMQLEIAITDGVANAVSALAFPRVDPRTGEIGTHFPELIEDDEKAQALVQSLVIDRPQARTLISPEENAALIFVSLDETDVTDDAESYFAYKRMEEAARAAAPADFEVLFSGLTPIGLTVVSALINDQIRLTLVGMLLGTGIAFVVFRSLLSALICAVPPALTAVCTLGFFAIMGVPINYLNTVLPTLALVLAFADTIMMYYKWNRLNRRRGSNEKAVILGHLKEAVRSVGPATALTSLTTVLAFYSFVYSANEALLDFAWLGMGAVTIAFLAVIWGLPMACYWVTQAGWVRPAGLSQTSTAKFGKWAIAGVTGRSVWICTGAIIATVVLYFAHAAIKPEYRITDYLPPDTETARAEAMINDTFGGRSLLFVSVPMANGAGLEGEESRARLEAVEARLERAFSAQQITSLNTVWRDLETDEARARVAQQLQEAEAENRQGYLSRDGKAMLVSVRILSNQSIVTTLDDIKKIEQSLSDLSFEGDIKISGFPVLMAQEFTRLIEDLRTSLLIAVALGIFVLAIATRSPFLAVAAITPNLLPILTVELVLYLRGAVISMTEVIALTVAFGIAIDNAVHVINVYSREAEETPNRREALQKTLLEVGPALGASSLIICVASLVTFISALPVIPLLGQLIIATLIVALVSNLFIFPANILTLSRIFPPKH